MPARGIAFPYLFELFQQLVAVLLTRLRSNLFISPGNLLVETSTGLTISNLLFQFQERNLDAYLGK